MPYADVSPVELPDLIALAAVRWASMLSARPDLAAAVDLQRALIGQVLDLTAALGAGPRPRLSLPARYLTTKLDSGIPALAGEPIPLPIAMLQPTVVALCRALADRGGEPAAALLRAVEEGRLDIGVLLLLAFRREQAAVRIAAARAVLPHDLLWLVAELAVSPFADLLRRTLFDGVSGASPLGPALARWSKGYCPLCGSWPVLIEQTATSPRRLRCSLCAAAWDLPDHDACVYCGESGAARVVLPTEHGSPGRRVETCTACRSYAKVVAVSASLPFPLVALLDLESMDLDLLAMQRGCARPAIRQFARR
jgi:FdhE protein